MFGNKNKKPALKLVPAEPVVNDWPEEFYVVEDTSCDFKAYFKSKDKAADLILDLISADLDARDEEDEIELPTREEIMSGEYDWNDIYILSTECFED